MNTDELARKIAATWYGFTHADAPLNDRLITELTEHIREHLEPLVAERDHYKGMWQKYQQVYADRDSLRTQLEQAREALPEDVRLFIRRVTLDLQKYASLTDAQKHILFNESYRFYVKYRADEKFDAALTPAKQPAEG